VNSVVGSDEFVDAAGYFGVAGSDRVLVAQRGDGGGVTEPGHGFFDGGAGRGVERSGNVTQIMERARHSGFGAGSSPGTAPHDLGGGVAGAFGGEHQSIRFGAHEPVEVAAQYVDQCARYRGSIASASSDTSSRVGIWRSLLCSTEAPFIRPIGASPRVGRISRSSKYS